MTTKLTIRDIARLAGVSTATVSRVLTNRPDIDPKTAARIQQIMKEHNFRPNRHASALRGKNIFIGVIAPPLSWVLVPKLLTGIANVIETVPYEMLLFTNNPSKGYEDVLDRILNTRMVAGLVVIPYVPISEQLITVSQQDMPVVLINIVNWPSNLPRVEDDNYGGARQATQHLISQGHQRIAFIQGPPELPCNQARYRGYCIALREAGIEPNEQLFLSGYYQYEDGWKAIDAIRELPAHLKPTAVFAMSDQAARGTIEEAHKHGIRIPDDLAVVGYSDILAEDRSKPSITSVEQPFYKMGSCAADMLLSLLNTSRPFPQHWPLSPQSLSSQDEETPQPLVCQLPTKLNVRDSSQKSTEKPA